MSATQGWSDPDGDRLQFQFSYTSETGPDAKYFSYAPQTASSYSTTLPTGNVQLFILLDVHVGSKKSPVHPRNWFI